MDQFLGISQVGWQALGVIVAFLTFTAGVFAAFAAVRQVRLGREVRELQTRPYVVCDIVDGVASRNLKDFSIKNVGTTPAYSVNITFSKAPERAREISGFELENTPMFKSPISMLAPGRELKVFFDNMIERKDSNLPRAYTVSVSYKGATRRKSFSCLRADPLVTPSYTDTFEVDAGVSISTPYAQVYGIHDLVKRVEEIGSLLGKSALGKRVLRVVTESREHAQERERDEQQQDIREHEEIVQQVLPSVGNNEMKSGAD